MWVVVMRSGSWFAPFPVPWPCWNIVLRLPLLLLLLLLLLLCGGEEDGGGGVWGRAFGLGGWLLLHLWSRSLAVAVLESSTHSLVVGERWRNSGPSKTF